LDLKLLRGTFQYRFNFLLFFFIYKKIVIRIQDLETWMQFELQICLKNYGFTIKSWISIILITFGSIFERIYLALAFI
jgi:hypothetical protein